MLFSSEQVANHINANFEASWEMVRPVPIIRIDFGNGHVVTRTLHGNIASYVCTANGQIADVLPGLYTPAVYSAALEQIRPIAGALASTGAEDQRLAMLRDYHGAKARFLRTSPARIAYPRVALAAPVPARAEPARPAELDRAKRTVELRIEQIVIQAPAAAPGGDPILGPRPRPGTNLADWPTLAADTWRNESQRRLQIHDRIAASESLRPEQLKRWLYRDVLHADLDDPYLGLGDALIGDDVFREEDA